MVIYIWFKEDQIMGWIPWDFDSAYSYTEWADYKRIVLPIAGCFYSEGLVFEIMTIMAGMFSPSELSAHVIMATTSSLFYFIAVGFNVTLTLFVWNSVARE